jgi:hypothetical protein
MPSSDDIWYAIANTEVLVAPEKLLETFDTTVINYHLLCEKMDSVNQIRVREGRVHAERPQVLAPAYVERVLLDGFGEEAQGYIDWLRGHISDLTFLKYGFRFKKEEVSESTIHESFETALARVKRHVEEKGDPLTAIIKGVDDSWETCLLKFVTDTIRKSAPQNFRDLKRGRFLEDRNGVPHAVHLEIEKDFEEVGTDSTKMKTLAEKLRHYGIFEQYEDRFYELVRRISH